MLAGWFAQTTAINEFFLGSYLGEIYYRWFPTEPSLIMTVISITLVLVTFATFASFSGLITDPIQSWTGIHRYRLQKFLKHLQADFNQKSENSFSPKDPYVARILELLDAAKSQLP